MSESEEAPRVDRCTSKGSSRSRLESLGNGGKDLTINIVNAKLKMFSRPLLLAVLIAGGQVLALVLIFRNLYLNCEVKQNIQPSGEAMMHSLSQLDWSKICIRKIMQTGMYGPVNQIPSVIQYDGVRFMSEKKQIRPCEFLESAIAFCGDRPVVYKKSDGPCPIRPSAECLSAYDDYISGRVEEIEPSQARTCITPCLVTRDKSTPGLGTGLVAYVDHTENVSDSASTGCRDWGIWSGNPLDDINKMWVPNAEDSIIIEYEECPAIAPTIGSTLGFAGFIEFGLTAVVVSALYSTGVINMRNTPFVKWVEDLVIRGAQAGGDPVGEGTHAADKASSVQPPSVASDGPRRDGGESLPSSNLDQQPVAQSV